MAQKMRSNEGGEKEEKKERKINLPKEPLIHKGFALCEKKRAVKEEEKLQLRNMEENKEMHFTKYGDKTQSNKSIHGHHSSDPENQ